MSATPQQQAEELADSAAVKCLEYLDIDPNYELGQDRANIANTILTAVNLPDLIQAKEERDALLREVDLSAEPNGAGTIATRLNFWKASNDELQDKVAILRDLLIQLQGVVSSEDSETIERILEETK